MFEEMQMVVHEESSIRGLFYSEYPQNWLYGFFNISPYQLPSFLNNFRRNQFRINWPVLLWFQAMRIVWVGTRKCLIKNGFVQNLHRRIVPCFLSIVRCIPCRWRVIYSECPRIICKDFKGMMGINIRKSEKLPQKIILPYIGANGLSTFPCWYIS